MSRTLLDLNKVDAFYGNAHILHGLQPPVNLRPLIWINGGFKIHVSGVLLDLGDEIVLLAPERSLRALQ